MFASTFKLKMLIFVHNITQCYPGKSVFPTFRGIGLALCEQLLAAHPSIKLCLACRNKLRAEKARSDLMLAYPAASIDIVIVDTSSVKSVLEAADIFKAK